MTIAVKSVSMTPFEPALAWRCKYSDCKHRWLIPEGHNTNDAPKRCAKCKRTAWNRDTYVVGRPKNSGYEVAEKLKPGRPKGRGKKPRGAKK